MKTALTALTALLLLLSLTGCASIFEAEVYSLTPYQEDTPSGDTLGSAGVSDYDGVLRSIRQMVEAHQDYSVIKLVSYDGNVNEDLQRAINETTGNTPLGAYSVEYIYYESRQIVSYYEAAVSIAYKRSKDQTDAVIPLSNDKLVRDRLSEMMRNLEDSLVFKAYGESLGAETIKAWITELYYGDSLLIPLMPSVEVYAYPETGSPRIFEIKPDYGMPLPELRSMSAALVSAVSLVSGRISASVRESSYYDAELLLEACKSLSLSCRYVTDLASIGDKPRFSNCAYGALLDGAADSEGFAMAFAAICRELDVECAIITGRYGKHTHFWNIVELDGDYYHIDPSLFTEYSSDSPFLRGDDFMRENYWWDTELYQQCDGDYNMGFLETTPEE